MAWMFWNASSTPGAARWLLVVFDIVVVVSSVDPPFCCLAVAVTVAVTVGVVGGALFPTHQDWEEHSIQEHPHDVRNRRHFVIFCCDGSSGCGSTVQ